MSSYPWLSTLTAVQSATDASPTPTPRKRGRKKAIKNAADKTAEIDKNENEDDDDNEQDTSSSPSKKAKNGQNQKKEIPTSYSSASKEDRMLIYMREVEGKSWGEIDSAWEAMTGTKPAPTTLRKRYGRIKANLAVFKDEDVRKKILSLTDSLMIS
ncbi:hypothetical protein VTN77DRAFT_758 [Rasamsonia byssochlamydoides]|uniref:uncharacterized protein n=1 Tax=Rasamsonia byssochlamydoides TaxID=89139 RepID=UPI0037422ED8